MTIVKRKPDMTSEDYIFLVRTLNIFFICGPAEKRVQAAEYLNDQRDRIIEHESKALARKCYKSWVPEFIFMTFSGYFIAVGIIYLIENGDFEFGFVYADGYVCFNACRIFGDVSLASGF